MCSSCTCSEIRASVWLLIKHVAHMLHILMRNPCLQIWCPLRSIFMCSICMHGRTHVIAFVSPAVLMVPVKLLGSAGCVVIHSHVHISCSCSSCRT